MPWWRRQNDPTPQAPTEKASRGLLPERTGGDLRISIPSQEPRRAGQVGPVSRARIAAALRRLGIRFLADEDGNLLALWERHAVLFALEGPDEEILVVRARAHGALPPEFADRAYSALNEWNHTRRFLKAYVGDPTERGSLSLYAEMQVPLVPGTHDALLEELLDCGTAVAGSWIDWLHDEGVLL